MDCRIFNYNYHATDTIDKLVALAGLEVLGLGDRPLSYSRARRLLAGYGPC